MNFAAEVNRLTMDAYPELFSEQRKADYIEEAKNEANRDKHQEVIDKISNDNYELNSLLVEFAIDEHTDGFNKLVLMALNSNDHTEMGRIFQKMIASGFESYVSMVGE